MPYYIRLLPDQNERKCRDCGLHFNPISMAPPGGEDDGMPIITPPVDYQCAACRLKVQK